MLGFSDVGHVLGNIEGASHVGISDGCALGSFDVGFELGIFEVGISDG